MGFTYWIIVALDLPGVHDRIFSFFHTSLWTLLPWAHCSSWRNSFRRFCTDWCNSWHTGPECGFFVVYSSVHFRIRCTGFWKVISKVGWSSLWIQFRRWCFGKRWKTENHVDSAKCWEDVLLKKMFVNMLYSRIGIQSYLYQSWEWYLAHNCSKRPLQAISPLTRYLGWGQTPFVTLCRSASSGILWTMNFCHNSEEGRKFVPLLTGDFHFCHYNINFYA